SEQGAVCVFDVVEAPAIPEVRVLAALADGFVDADRDAVGAGGGRPVGDEAIGIDTGREVRAVCETSHAQCCPAVRMGYVGVPLGRAIGDEALMSECRARHHEQRGRRERDGRQEPPWHGIPPLTSPGATYVYYAPVSVASHLRPRIERCASSHSRRHNADRIGQIRTDVKTPGALLGGRLRASWRQQDQPLLSPPVLWSASGGLAERYERSSTIGPRCDRATSVSMARPPARRLVAGNKNPARRR